MPDQKISNQQKPQEKKEFLRRDEIVTMQKDIKRIQENQAQGETGTKRIG